MTTYILWHDAAEVMTGDLPFPIKSEYPELREIMDDIELTALSRMNIRIPDIGPTEKWCVKICDLTEMLEFGAQEMWMGNTFGQPIVDGTFQVLTNMLADFPKTVRPGAVDTIRKLINDIKRGTKHA